MARVALSVSPEAARFSPTATTRFGLIALATDMTSERDLYRQTEGSDVAIHVTRLAFENPTTPENLRQMAPRLTDAAGLLAPLLPLSAVCYSCTAATVVIGDDAVRRSIQKALPDVPVVTPTAAAMTAFQALGVQRIAVLTPYTIATSEPMAAFFSGQGLDVVNFDCLGVEDDRDMARLSRETIVNAAVAADREDAEALFISCTALPALTAVGEIESRIGKPVVTSNQAAGWLLTRLGGLTDHHPTEFGKLYSLDLAREKA
ncbi:aspartate/glutamate racemase family protein [Roseibium sp. MMSF_3544]|uniref:aspartate racemase/maleate isomerase family protein n=1 Tax=unclassified Roseibium TaxID=2629323 RepID=UPI00273E34DE|nr:aspartate/glutamate racemase family protein [Roseibium sp. MMSF_3544]